jgi:hypothetical protein
VCVWRGGPGRRVGSALSALCELPPLSRRLHVGVSAVGSRTCNAQWLKVIGSVLIDVLASQSSPPYRYWCCRVKDMHYTMVVSLLSSVPRQAVGDVTRQASGIDHLSLVAVLHSIQGRDV